MQTQQRAATPDTLHRSLVLALTDPAPGVLTAWLQQHSWRTEDLAWLERQSLLIYAFYRIQAEDALHHLPAAVVAQWQTAYYQAATTVAAVDWQLGQIFARLHEAKIEFTWVKGGSLAHTIYPSPVCRARGDVDLWVESEEWPRAISVLQSLGYATKDSEDRPNALTALVGGEQQLRRPSPRPQLVELQTPLLRGEWARYTAAIDYAAIWQRRRSLKFGAQTIAILSPEDMLIHLCLHQAINHQFSKPWLRNLLDVHLLATSQTVEWLQVVERAKSWRVTTAIWVMLDLAHRLFATPISPAVMAELAPAAFKQSLIRLLHLDTLLLSAQELGYSHRRLLIQMTLADRWRDDLYLVGRSLWPEDRWLQARYTPSPHQSLIGLHWLHLKSLLLSARA